ncbi:MAG: hypothetical protein AB7I27_07000 [Bacteriovoracaceae bacterium]
MKFLVLFILSTNLLYAASSPKKAQVKVPIKKEQSKVKAPAKKEEDCNEKIKKTVDVSAESISLTGATGCTLDEAH